MFAIAACLVLSNAQLPKTEHLALPLPDWADSLDLAAGDDYLNERESTPQAWRNPHPEIRVGELLGGLEEDAELVPGDQTRHARPAGVKFVGEDETDFTLKRNGLVRSASWATENWVSGYLVTAEPKSGDGRLFGMWLKRLRATLGKPSFGVKNEQATYRQGWSYTERSNEVVWLSDDCSQVAFAWVWGTRDRSVDSSDVRLLWDRRVEDEALPHHDPSYSITLMYTAPHVEFRDSKDKVGRRYPAIVSFHVNPFGTLSG